MAKDKSIQIDRVRDSNGAVTFEPLEILKRVRLEYSQWFRPRVFTEFAKDSEFAREYQPMAHIKDEWFAPLLDIPTPKELQDAMAHMGKRKAPGPSGLSMEVWMRMGKSALRLLHLAATLMHKYHDVPPVFSQFYILPIPKSDDWEGDISRTRPIALAEHMAKAIESIQVRKLSAILVEHPEIMSGSDYSALPGMSCIQPITILRHVFDYCNEKKQNLNLIITDISKCFDSVTVKGMKDAFARIRMPYGSICRIINAQKRLCAKALTAVGVTDAFAVGTPIPQGFASSPLFFKIYFDPLHAVLQKHTEKG